MMAQYISDIEEHQHLIKHAQIQAVTTTAPRELWWTGCSRCSTVRWFIFQKMSQTHYHTHFHQNRQRKCHRHRSYVCTTDTETRSLTHCQLPEQSQERISLTEAHSGAFHLSRPRLAHVCSKWNCKYAFYFLPTKCFVMFHILRNEVHRSLWEHTKQKKELL